MKTLEPEMLKYAGYFRLRSPSGRPPWERFGHGGYAMTYSAANDSLFIAGHAHYDLVAEVPVPLHAPGWDFYSNQRADVLEDFFDPAPWRTLEERKLLDTLSGLLIRDGVLYSLHHTFYGVPPAQEIDVPTLALHDLAGPSSFNTPQSSPRFFHIGPQKHPFTQKATSGYLFDAPEGWCEANGIPGQTMLCGRGDGAGNATSPKGPALFAFDPRNPENATTLLYRAKGQEPSKWTPCDKWTGGAWIRAGEYEAVIFVGEVAAEPWWYGKWDMPDEKPAWWNPMNPDWREAWREFGPRDTWRPGAGSKGYHTTRREVRLQMYLPESLDAFYLHYDHTLDVFHEAANPRAMAYDEAGRRFFVYENYPPVDGSGGFTGEEPRVHCWKVEVPEDEAEKPFEPAERITVSIRIDGETYAGDLGREDE